MNRHVNRSLAMAIVMASIMVFTLIGMAIAGEQILSAKVTSVTTNLDKNGNEYTRLIVDVDRKIQGVSYTVGTPAMAFGSLNAEAKTMAVGDTLNCIASERQYNGRTSFTIIKMLPKQ